MNFWEAQRRARSRTGWFLLLFTLLTIAMAFFIEVAMRYLVEDYQESPIPLLGIMYGLITFLAAGTQYAQFKAGGGGVVAETLGARRIHEETQDRKERQLLNIVKEMALAASLPIPAVYVLPAQQINAFAAGLTAQDAAVTVTEGTLRTLDRDELQGVVAHELGHIYNADMKISMRLAALLMGFFFVLYLGLRLFQFTSYQRTSNDRQGNPFAIAALLFIAAGALTWLFGSLLKCAISREREYLADACAVQFTRNPDGIANALRKIAQEQVSDMPAYGEAYSHLYLEDNSGWSVLFQTHPPIKKRIEAILGRRYTQTT